MGDEIHTPPEGLATQLDLGIIGGTSHAAVHNTSSGDIIMVGCTSTSNVTYNFHGIERSRGEFEGRYGSDMLQDERVGKRRWMEEEDGIKIIRRVDLKLKQTIGRRSGYYLHTGQNEGRAVIVKVFNRGLGLSIRQRLKSTAALSRELMHPNLLQMEGISSSTSLVHFIVYEGVHWKNAEGPLAVALKTDLNRSITLGFRMVEGLSAGMDYLFVQGIPMSLENLDVFLDVDDRFILSITAPQFEESDATESRESEDRIWNVFNALCKKTLLSANRVLHHEQINRDPTVLDAVRPGSLAKISAWSSSSLLGLASSLQDIKDEELPVPRREYVWRAMDRGKQSLATVAHRIALDLDLNLSPVNRLTQTDWGNPHRCSGYLREEITLATTTLHSAVVAHDTPSPLETCPICHEVVAIQEIFRCRCGESDPGSGATVKCRECKLWSHSDCVGNPQKEFTCELCKHCRGWTKNNGPNFDSKHQCPSYAPRLALPNNNSPNFDSKHQCPPYAPRLALPNNNGPNFDSKHQCPPYAPRLALPNIDAKHDENETGDTTEYNINPTREQGEHEENGPHSEANANARYHDRWGRLEAHVPAARVTQLMVPVGAGSGLEILQPFGCLLTERVKTKIEYLYSRSGSPNNPRWTAYVYINDIEYGSGIGSSKGSARERAAKSGLIALGILQS
ncbi:hypothetical protein MVEN_01182200 [Mycena venus]|uniref:DRBM domain-containing protein n=1 Tax=Mycena venus TaxID=2733690 RepID=A0A8H6Y5C3_9AGAR|nr:hypothetical protein MVEN_01182200 [Mycena venus]